MTQAPIPPEKNDKAIVDVDEEERAERKKSEGGRIAEVMGEVEEEDARVEEGGRGSLMKDDKLL